MGNFLFFRAREETRVNSAFLLTSIVRDAGGPKFAVDNVMIAPLKSIQETIYQYSKSSR